MACSKLEARGHLLHKTGTPPKYFSRECRYLPKITQPFHFNCNKKLSEGSHFIRGAKLPSDQQNNIPSNIQQSFLYSLTQFLVGIKKLNHKWQILSQQHHFGKIFLIRVHVCYVKLGRKRPDFEKTKSTPGQGAGTRTLCISTPGQVQLPMYKTIDYLYHYSALGMPIPWRFSFHGDSGIRDLPFLFFI